MLNQRGGSKADTAVKLVLIFFISLLSFSVGTFVGKQVSDSDYKRAALEEDYKSFRQAGHQEESDHSSDEKGSHEELASLTEEFVSAEKEKMKAEAHESTEMASHEEQSENKEKDSSNHSGYKKYGKGQPSEEHPAQEGSDSENSHQAVAEHSDSAKMKKGAHSKDESETSHANEGHPTVAGGHTPPVTTEAKRLAEGLAPVADPKKVRQPTSILPSVATSSVGKYTIQVASYAMEAEAKAHASELKQKGWNAFYVPAEVSSKTWYRVSVGLFPDQKSAQSFRQELMKQSSISDAIVQKIVQ